MSPVNDPAHLIYTLQQSAWEAWPAQTASACNALSERQRFDLGIVELPSPDDTQTFHWVEQVLQQMSDLPWIALVEPAHLSAPRTRALILEHCEDYHTLPVDPGRLATAAGHIHGMARLAQAEPVSNHHHIPSQYGVVGESAQMSALIRRARKVAQSEVPVLLSGESGTGKERIASLIHRLSPRASGPFVAVNCAALPASLIQAELFGYERGAFTGANKRQIGRIEAASGGTLFFDEIADIPYGLQVNLLRFLQEGTLERLGSHQTLHIDARIVTATHVDLDEAVRQGRFREDLYYRLNVVRITLPPLRERGTDVLHLAQHFLDMYAESKRSMPYTFTPDAVDAITSYRWPGNVRELMNRVRQAAVLSDSRLISARDLALNVDNAPSRRPTLAEARELAERSAIIKALTRNKVNISQTARELGVSRVTIYRLMEKHGIAPSH
ncbi:MAG: sigma-54-dependent Fis family transcriptional regulator [Gammaproteobacteria bacterium]|nr:sigma-54-dependent Fis family transcriptional regulator [Gammaproteobacteria bacterium]